MARIRSTKPELWRAREIADLPSHAFLTFIGLLTAVDDEGRIPDDARLIKADIYPFADVTAADVEADLAALAAGGELICRYESGSRRYLHVHRFRDDRVPKELRSPWGQRPQRPQPSRCPPCEIRHELPGQGELFDFPGTVSDNSPPDPGTVSVRVASKGQRPTGQRPTGQQANRPTNQQANKPAGEAGEPPTPGQRAHRLARDYEQAAGGPIKFIAVQQIITRFLDRDHDDGDIGAALARLAAANRPVTIDTLRVELNGGTRRSTTDDRVRQGLNLAERYAAEERAGAQPAAIEP